MDDPDAVWDRVRALEAVYDELVRRTAAGDVSLSEGGGLLRERLAQESPAVLAMSWRFHVGRDRLRFGWADGEWQGG
jgi:hypothetical protein